MYSFKNDYSEGAHPQILKKLIETNFEQHLGYGEDDYSIEAKSLLKQKIANPDAEIYFVSGGTQSNILVIDALLRAHEAVICVSSGHIYTHEAGAIEAIGHRVITLESPSGKLHPTDVAQLLGQYTLRPHVVKPRMLYISNATEVGTIYSRAELSTLYSFCQAEGLLLFIDGARLGHALTAKDNDVTLSDMAQFSDVFYIGGTKNGALFGEAIVFNRPDLALEFDYLLKQKGALLAKGRILGIQFLELFKDNLYFDLARHANKMAMKIAHAMRDEGYSFLTPPCSNQIFPILPNKLIQKLSEKYLFYEWKVQDEDQTAIRLITSWATDESKVDEFIEEIKNTSAAHDWWATMEHSRAKILKDWYKKKQSEKF